MKHYFTLTTLDVDVLFRTLAIIAIIYIHTSAAVNIITGQSNVLPVGGGSTLLLLISGFNIARFQSKKLFEGLSLQIVIRFFRKIIIPYYFVIICYQLWKQQFDLHTLLLISNYYGRFGSFLEPYWFIEALLQILIIFTALFTIPPFRKLTEKQPLIIGLVLLCLTVFLRLSQLTDIKLGLRTADQLLCVYIFGWCVWFAKTVLQKIAISVLAIILFIYLYNLHPSFTVWLIVGCLAIMWKPKILMPKCLHQLIVLIGTSTFYIYLIHIIPVHYMTYGIHFLNIPIIIIVSLTLGILIQKALNKIKL